MRDFILLLETGSVLLPQIIRWWFRLAVHQKGSKNRGPIQELLDALIDKCFGRLYSALMTTFGGGGGGGWSRVLWRGI